MTYLVYFADSGVPETGLTLTWEYLLTVSAGGNYTPQPAFVEIGGGWYKFVLTPTEAVVGVIDGSATLGDADRYAAFDGSVIESLTVEALLKRLVVIFDGDVTRTGDVLEFEDEDAAVETTHTITTAGRAVT